MVLVEHAVYVQEEGVAVVLSGELGADEFPSTDLVWSCISACQKHCDLPWERLGRHQLVTALWGTRGIALMPRWHSEMGELLHQKGISLIPGAVMLFEDVCKTMASLHACKHPPPVT